MNSAYQVEITVRAGSSLLRVFVEKMRQVCNKLNPKYCHYISFLIKNHASARTCFWFQLMHTMPWKTPPVINEDWKRNVAADMLDSLSESRSVIFLHFLWQVFSSAEGLGVSGLGVGCLV